MNFCYHCMSQLPDQKQNTCPYCGAALNESAAAPDVLPPGTVLQGKFVTGTLLGSGGFGNTYIGWNQVLSCRVAVKEFFPRHMSVRGGDRKTISVADPAMRERYGQSLQNFLEEARRLAELGSVHGIPDIYGYFVENGTGYIVMEYIEGITVKQLMKDSGGTLGYERARQIILSVLYTLKEIHRRGILHRDIAPDNIMLTRDGGVALIDFGVARKQMDDAADSVIMLKHGYSPPEQYARNAVQGVYTDLYSLAAVFYHMITGMKPPGVGKRRENDTLLPPSHYGVKIAEQAEIAVMMCLYLNPEYRLASAEEFMIALNGRDFKPAVQREQVEDFRGERMSRRTDREFPFIGQAAVILLLVAAVTVGIVLTVYWKESEVVDSRSKVILAEQITGMTEEEATEALKEKSGTGEITFEVSGILFDKNVENGSEILTQEPAAGSEITDGKITGIVRTNSKCTYQDIWDQKDNVDSLVKTFGIDKGKLAASEEADAGDEKKTFKNLYEIILADGTRLSQETLQKEKNMGILDLSRIQSVTYYVSPYLYKKKLGNYIGKNVNDISFTKYTEKDKKKKAKGTGHPSSSPKYYSFNKKPGYIVEQKIKPGKAYNSSQYEGELFVTVKEEIMYDAHNADSLIKKLKERGFKDVKEEGSGSEIAGIKVSGKGGSDYFTMADTITVKRKEKAVVSPKQVSPKEPKTPKTPSNQIGLSSSPLLD